MQMEDKMTDIHTAGELQKKRVSFSLGLFALIFVGIFIMVLFWNLYFSTYDGYKTTSKMEIGIGTDSTASSGGNYIICANDGAKAIDPTGKVVWEMAYEMDDPVVITRDGATAVYDRNGKTVYIMASTGIPYALKVHYPIRTADISAQGIVALILDDGLNDYVRLYDIEGNLKLDINTKTKTDGIPINVAISPDGTKLVILHVTFEEDKMLSKVTFYNCGEVGKNYYNNIVGQKTFEPDIFAAVVKFLDDDRVVIVKDNGFCLYKMENVPALLKDETIKGEIMDITWSKSAVLVALKTEKEQKRLLWYNTNGKLSRNLTINGEYVGIYAGDDEMAVLEKDRLTIYRKNGSKKLNQKMDSIFSDFAFGSARSYFLVDAGSIQTIKISE